jgi:hypothetical protein
MNRVMVDIEQLDVQTLRYPLISGMGLAGFRARALGGGWLGHDMTGRDE